MKTMLMAILILAVLASFAGAQTVKMEWGDDGSTNLGMFWRENGTFVYAFGSENWAEAYVGATYSPAPWAEVALGVGLEQADDPFRLGGWIWLGQEKVSFLHLFEDGGSGPWHKTTLSYAVDERLSVGAIDRSFLGRGAFAELALDEGRSINITDYEGGGWTASLSQSF